MHELLVEEVIRAYNILNRVQLLCNKAIKIAKGFFPILL